MSQPGFVQVIEFNTSRYEDGEKLVDTYLAKTEGKRTSGHAMTLRDRENPTRYYTIVEFASAEAATKNSELPETQELAAGLAALADGPPNFYNLDVVRLEDS